MNKKFLLILVILFGGMCFFFYEFKTTLPKEEENINESNDKKAMFSNINNIELYATDYQYSKTVPGYSYVKVDLTNEQIENIKKELVNVNLNHKVQDVVYGKYKLIIDDKTIFFDVDTDSALYLEGNQVFRLSNDIKRKFITSTDTCSCCTTSNCKINLCTCKSVN